MSEYDRINPDNFLDLALKGSLPDNTSKQLEAFETKQLHVLYEKFRTASEAAELRHRAACPNQTGIINSFRSKVGLWYSALILGDLLSYDPEATDPASRLQSRMHALLREALAWFPDSCFAQVLLDNRGDSTDGFHECIGLTRDLISSGSAVRDRIGQHVMKDGTTASWDIHFLRLPHWYPDKPHCTDGHQVEFPEQIDALPMALLGKRSKQPNEENRFFDNVVRHFFPPNTSLILLHLTGGADVWLQSDTYTTIAHLYVLGKISDSNSLQLHKDYFRAMDMLISNLCSFSAIQRSVRAVDLARAQEALARKTRDELQDEVKHLDMIVMSLNQRAGQIRMKFGFNMGRHLVDWCWLSQ
jgi:hypothetical protein